MSRVGFRSDCGVAFLRLEAPTTGNALDPGLVADLAEAWSRAEADAGCRAVVLEAEGEEFSRGMDLAAAFDDQGRVASPEAFERYVEVLSGFCRSALPVVARVDGAVSGGALGLVAACDLVLAGPRATFALPEVIVGMVPALVAPFLLRRLRPGALRAMALGSRTLTGGEAERLGLVDQVCADGELDGLVRRQLERLLRSSPEALAATKQYLERLAAGSLDVHLDEARRTLGAWLARPDAALGPRTFAAGLAPPWFRKWRGRG
jgi:enoyl-CoA hydratase/carnithine racemase